MEGTPFSHHHHHHHHRNTTNVTHNANPGETVFRMLCPAGKAGGVIGKGGAVIKQLREETGAKIRVIDETLTPQCDERVILVAAVTGEEGGGGVLTAAQRGLVRVFERMVKVDEERERSGGGGGGEEEGRRESGERERGVCCRMLAPGSQVGSVLGRGGKIVEKIRVESAARVRVLPRDCLPGCACPGDELIQISGNFHAVKKALLMVASCLEHPRADPHPAEMDSFPLRAPHPADHQSRGALASSAPEEEVLFRILCPADKIGSLIGKGGCVIRVIENESGASIKIGDAVTPDTDERVVVVSARETLDLKRSPAQDGVIRVHGRISEVGFEPGAAVVARLLVHSQQIGCLLGKGGHIIEEMRRVTGANIRIFGRELGSKFGSSNDEVVQIIGNLKTVQDAIFQITTRLRESAFPPRAHPSHVNSSSYVNSFQELPSPSFRPRHDQHSPNRYHSHVGSHNYDNHSTDAIRGHPSAFSHGRDRSGSGNSEQESYRYGSDRASFERPPSPGAWTAQANNGYPARFSDVGPGSSGLLGSHPESGQMPNKTSVEVVVPQILLPHVYGENKTNLGDITQFSGANVVVHDPKPGATEGLVVISGTPSQLHTAQSLVQAFILCGQAF